MFFAFLGDDDEPAHKAAEVEGHPAAAVTSQLTVPSIAASRRESDATEGRSHGKGNSDAPKPKIWSLAHTATSDSPPTARRSLQPTQIPSLHPLTQNGFFFTRPWHDARALLQQGYPLPGITPITSAARLTAPTPVMPAMMSPLTPHKIRLTTEDFRRPDACHLAAGEGNSQSSPSSSSNSSSPVGKFDLYVFFWVVLLQTCMYNHYYIASKHFAISCSAKRVTGRWH